jgi:hypothetical protein
MRQMTGLNELRARGRTSRRDLRARGVWQGVNPRTGSVASAIWVSRPVGDHAIVFIEVDGDSLEGDHDDPVLEHDRTGRMAVKADPGTPC